MLHKQHVCFKNIAKWQKHQKLTVNSATIFDFMAALVPVVAVE